MTVIVIGLGSMGKRRIRLIKTYNSAIKIIGIDTNPERTRAVECEYAIKTDKNLEHALLHQTIDAAFICTSPLSHAKLIATCLVHGVHIFTELNLVDDNYYENIALAEKNNTILFLSSTMQYRKEVAVITNDVKVQTQPVKYNYHIGQYLPDWHPWESIHDFFVSDKRTNGCREIFAIELPWLIRAFGDIENIQVQKSKMSTLDIDYPDNYTVTLTHCGGNQGVLLVDVVSKKAVRDLTVFNETLFMQWDGSPSGLKRYAIDSDKMMTIDLYQNAEQREDYRTFIVENAYLDEIIHFFEVIEGRRDLLYSFADDQKVLELIDRIEA